MSNLTLIVPPNQFPDDWFFFINESLNSNNNYDCITVDFNEVCFMETDDFVVLACLIETLKKEDCSIQFKGGTLAFNEHLDNIRFKEYWNHGFDRGKYTASKNNTTLCLWKISQPYIPSYSHYAKDYFTKRFAKSKDLMPLATNLTEVFNNIFDHSKSKMAYVITQYFPKLHTLSFSVCDFGIGIANTVNAYRAASGEENISDAEAIALSLELGFSVKSSPRNRGVGLDQIKEFVQSSQGTLTITSNNGQLFLEADEGIAFYETDYDFKGTLIRVDVATDTFEDIDSDELTLDF